MALYSPLKRYLRHANDQQENKIVPYQESSMCNIHKIRFLKYQGEIAVGKMTCFLSQRDKYDQDLFDTTWPIKKSMEFYSYVMSKEELEQVSTETIINC